MDRTKKILIILAAVLAVGLIACGVVLGVQAQNGKVYTEKISDGDRYYMEGDYISAIASYEAAIRTNPTGEGGYVSLARVYYSQGQTDLALGTLNRGMGMARTTFEIRRLLEEYEGGGGMVISDAKMYLNEELLKGAGNTRYSKYVEQYSVASRRIVGDKVAIRFQGINAEMVFANTAQQPGAVREGSVTSNALPVEIHYDDVAEILGAALPISFAQLEQAGLAELSITSYNGVGTVVRFIGGGCEVLIASDANGNISAGAWNLVVPNYEDQKTEDGRKTGDGSKAENVNTVKISGTVTDAADGSSLEDASLYFYTSDGLTEMAAEARTSGSGEYSLELSAGDYKVRVSRDGYQTVEAEFTLSDSFMGEKRDFQLEKDPNAAAVGEITVVLSWNDIPVYEFAHLLGMTDSGEEVHVCYYYPDYYLGNSLGKWSMSGNESTTVLYDPNGVYNLYIENAFDFYYGTSAFASDNITATVYIPGQSPITVDLSDGSWVDAEYWNISGHYQERMWRVFTIDHGRLTVG